MVEWTALEMRRTLTGTLGSNPSLSAPENSHPGVLRQEPQAAKPVLRQEPQAAKPERIPVSPLEEFNDFYRWTLFLHRIEARLQEICAKKSGLLDKIVFVFKYIFVSLHRKITKTR